MNTGVAYMRSVSLQRLNSSGDVLYQEELSILDSFGEYDKLTEKAFSLYSIEEATVRYLAFINWVKESYLQTSKEVLSEDFIDLDSVSCLLPNSDWNSIPNLNADTTLKVGKEGTAVLSTSFDSVGIVEDHTYLLEFHFIHEEFAFGEVDYLSLTQGELVYKSEVPRKDIVFDINSKGELIVIGKDAEHYFLNDLGELCYKY